MPDELWRRMATGSLVPVVIVIPRDLSPGRVADELLEVFDLDDPLGEVIWLPLLK